MILAYNHVVNKKPSLTLIINLVFVNLSALFKLWVDFSETKDDSLGYLSWNKKEVTEFVINSY